MFPTLARFFAILSVVFLFISVGNFMSQNTSSKAKKSNIYNISDSCIPFLGLYMNLPSQYMNHKKKSTNEREFVKQVLTVKNDLRKENFPINKFFLTLVIYFDKKEKKFLVRNSASSYNHRFLSLFFQKKRFHAEDFIYDLDLKIILQLLKDQKILISIEETKNIESFAKLDILQKQKNIIFITSPNEKFLKYLFLRKDFSIPILRSFKNLVRFQIMEIFKWTHAVSLESAGVISSYPLEPNKNILTKFKTQKRFIFQEQYTNFDQIPDILKIHADGWISHDPKLALEFIKKKNPCFSKK